MMKTQIKLAVVGLMLVVGAVHAYYEEIYYPVELQRFRRQSEGSVTGGVNASPGGGAAVNLGANNVWKDKDAGTSTGIGGTYTGTFGEGKPRHDIGLMGGHKWDAGQATIKGNIPLNSNGRADLGANLGGRVWQSGSSSLDLNSGYAGQFGNGKPSHGFTLGATHTSPGSTLGVSGQYGPGGRGAANVDYNRQIWKGPGGQSFDVTSTYSGRYGGGRPNHGFFIGGKLGF